MEKNKRGEKEKNSERPKAEYWNPKICPLCGNNEFKWGKVISDNMGSAYFRADDAGIGGGKRLRGRQCTRCGSVQLFADRD